MSTSPTEVRPPGYPPSLPCDSQGRTPAEAGLRRLAANLAHNVNNTLTGVIGYLELALRDVPAGSRARGHLDQSLACAQRVADMVRRILAYAFRPTGPGERELTSLRRIAERFAQTAGGPAVTAVVRDGSDGLIRVNVPLLELALDQVVRNALEAMPDGGTLLFRVWDEAGRRCLSVTDTGRGMPRKVRQHLFEPFFTTKCSGHLGLGLALARDALEAQGGTVRVESAEGRGTTVTLSFPPADQAGTDAPPSDERVAEVAADRLNPYPGPHFANAAPPISYDI